MSDPMQQRDIARRLEQTQVIERRGGAGTSQPTGISAGFRFFRTDLGMDTYYDGTRWLSVHEYDANLQQTAFTVAGSYVIEPLRQDYAPYITRLGLEYIVLTTNNAGNNWLITIRGGNATYAATTTIHTFNTSAIAANTWTNIDTATPSGTAIPSNRAFFDIAATINAGAPGVLAIAATLYYRLIIT